MMRYVVGNIREYDIAQCNINIMRKLGIISPEKFTELSTGPKQNRVVVVGKMIRDNPQLYKDLTAEVNKTMDLFISENKIDETCILERAYDAIWINNIFPKSLIIDGIELKDKRQATALLEIDKFRFYYNSVTGEFYTRFVGVNFSEKLLNDIKKYIILKGANDYKKLYVEYHKDRIDNQSDSKYISISNELMGLVR